MWLLDQLTKWWMLVEGRGVINRGVSFGLGQGLAYWFVFVIVLMVLFWKMKGKGKFWIFIIAGGLGNIVDRVIYGGVVDWIGVAGLWFNLADVMINIGLLGSIFEIIRDNDKQDKNNI